MEASRSEWRCVEMSGRKEKEMKGSRSMNGSFAHSVDRVH